jgi:hypothetical protein
MTREREQAGHQHAAAPMAQPDFDAEHDPEVARRASLAGLRAVQQKAQGGAESINTVHAAADRGVASPTTAMPFADKIQASFGAEHDISGIQAHVGGNAAAAMGASAFAAGNHVVFDRSPDLHTAAHEAAHVVQQAKGVNLYGGVGEAGDAYERHADAVADRVVAGQSAGDLLKAGPGGAAPGIQQAPSQDYADQSAMQAIQSHMHLTAMRMYSASSRVYDILKLPTNGDAGTGPMLQLLQEQVDGVNNDLDNLASQINKVPNIVHGALDDQARELRGAIHDDFGWAMALNAVYSFTHDAGGNLNDDAQGTHLAITPTIAKIDGIFQTLGISHDTIGITHQPRYGNKEAAAEGREQSLLAAEIDALKTSMWSVDVAVDLINADLHSSVQDQSKEATDLAVSIQTLVDVLEPIDPSHIGKIAKLPLLIKKIEAMQAEINKMKEADDDKGKALAPRIGYGSALSNNLHRMKVKIDAVKTVNAANARQHH